MTTSKTTSVLIKTDDLKGSGSTEYNNTNNQRIGAIKLTWTGGTLSFGSVSEYQAFFANVLIPLTNVLNSPSAAGSAYVAVTNGVAGSDKVID